jgi:chorismate dehydratase
MKAKKIGTINFLNAEPIFFGMRVEGNICNYQLESYVPVKSTELLEAGELDLAIIPTILYANFDDLFIVPEVSISSHGPVGSVMLFCNKPLEEIKTIAVDDRSRTSVALLKILCHEYYKIEPEFVDMQPDAEAMLQKADAALVIGDPALFFEGKVNHIQDLATDWFEHTRHPFVFAILAGTAESADIEDVYAVQDSLRVGLANVQKIAENYPSPSVPHAKERNEKYLTENINYNFGSRELDGLKLFYIKAWEHGIIDSIPHIRFYEK